MVLLLDKMSERYHCLPSQAVREADTLDVFVLTRALEYYDRKRHPEKFKAETNISQEDLMTILNSQKGK
jgi:hypothetical protein